MAPGTPRSPRAHSPRVAGGRVGVQRLLAGHARALREYLDEWDREQQRLVERELGGGRLSQLDAARARSLSPRGSPRPRGASSSAAHELAGGFGAGDSPLDFAEINDFDFVEESSKKRPLTSGSSAASGVRPRILLPQGFYNSDHLCVHEMEALKSNSLESNGCVPPSCEDGLSLALDVEPDHHRLHPSQSESLDTWQYHSAGHRSEGMNPLPTFPQESNGVTKTQAMIMLGKKEQKRTAVKTKIEEMPSRTWEAKRRDTILGEVHKPMSAKCVESSTLFNMVCNLVIVSNTVVLTVLIERQANGHGREGPLEDVDLFFTVFYTGELLLRLVVHRVHFFYGKDCNWRWLDMMLVVAAAAEQVGLQAGTGMNINTFRILRLLKIMKVLRMLRVMRSLREIRILLDSILGAVKSIFWSVVLMICTTFMFALCFMQAATTESGIAARKPWNSLSSSMSALFAAASGGMDWVDLADPLFRDGVQYYVIFFFYIGFFLFVLNNAMTSLFVQKLLANVANDETFMVEDRLIRKSEYTRQIESLFKRMDTDNDGQVSFQDLCLSLHDKEMSAFAASLEIEEADLSACFSIITSNGAYRIDLENFVTGCIKLRGMAKSVDIIDVAIAQNNIAENLHKLCEEHAQLREALQLDDLKSYSSERLALASLPEEVGPDKPAAGGPPQSDRLDQPCTSHVETVTT